MQQSKKPHILIVDDTSKNIQMLATILKQQGYQISAALNGCLALEMLTAVSPDLILLDIMMPEMDGFETCKRIKDNDKTKDIPIIFLTASNDSDNLIKGFELGAVDYLTKPFNSMELLVRVKNHIDLKQSKEELLKQSNSQKELLQIMCHDLANSIHFMLSLVDLAKENPDMYIKMENNIIKTLNNAAEIIQLVRQMRSLEDRKLQLTLEKIPLKAAIREAHFILKQKLANKNLELLIDIQDDIYVTVERTSFINSVITNIITNAIKFSFTDSKIIIRANTANDRVLLSIKDFGIGIPEFLLNNIFDFNKPTTREGTSGETGTGYGMPLVKKFITVYGGDIQVRSREKLNEKSNDHGTEILLTLS